MGEDLYSLKPSFIKPDCMYCERGANLHVIEVDGNWKVNRSLLILLLVTANLVYAGITG